MDRIQGLRSIEDNSAVGAFVLFLSQPMR